MGTLMAGGSKVNRKVLRLARSAGALVLVAAAVLLASVSDLSRSLDDRISELRFRFGERDPSGEIVLVDIDAKSLAEIGVWPWPRHLHGDLVKAAERSGAARLAFDVDFSASSVPGEDRAFAAALSQTNVETFLAGFVQQDSTAGAELRTSLPIDALLENSWPAMVNIPIDADGRIRRFPFALDASGEVLQSMPSVLSNQDGKEGVFGIDYSISARTLPHVSYSDLLNGRLDGGALTGKTLIVGATALELHDLFPVPVHGIVSGSTIIALATETLLQNRALSGLELPWPLLAALGCVALLAIRCFSVRWTLGLLVGAGLCAEALALYLQHEQTVVLATASLHFMLAGMAIWALVREFDLRRILLWVARLQTKNSGSVLERVIDDGFDAVVIFDHEGRVMRFNRKACELLDLPAMQRLESLPPKIVDDVRTTLEVFQRGDQPSGRSFQPFYCSLNKEEQVLEYTIAPFWMDAINEWEGKAIGASAHACLTLRDVTERHRAQNRMRFMALHDSLTGLANRRALEEHLDEVLRTAPDGGGFALFCFDLDRFKGVNDALGHSTGDKVLVEVGRRAKATLAEAALVARIGGDEFAALLSANSLEAAQNKAVLLAKAIDQPFLVSGHRISIGASVGISWWDGGSATATSVMRHGDIALYRAKRSSTQQVVAFKPFMDEDRLARLELEHDLSGAFEKMEFEVVYQPQFRLDTRELVGAEALLRWKHAVKGIVSPVQFIPVAEEMGLIHRLGSWVLEAACCEAMRWEKPIKIAVNVSALQFETGDLVGAVRHALEASKLPPGRLELEITESAFVGESDKLKGIFDQLLAIGVTFSLDDFGTGYSSLGYLHRFPVSKIKIDRSFVTEIPKSGHSMAVLRSIRALADGLGLRTIAEGIETNEQAEALRILGCDDGQGFLFSKPVDAATISRLLRSNGGALHQRLQSTAA